MQHKSSLTSLKVKPGVVASTDKPGRFKRPVVGLGCAEPLAQNVGTSSRIHACVFEGIHPVPNATNSHLGSDRIRWRGETEDAQRIAAQSHDLGTTATPSDNSLNSDFAPQCGNCGSPARAALNPFYGRGLAVHEYVLLCQRCDWTGVLTAPCDPEDACVMTKVSGHRFLRAARAVSALICDVADGSLMRQHRPIGKSRGAKMTAPSGKSGQ